MTFCVIEWQVQELNRQVLLLGRWRTPSNYRPAALTTWASSRFNPRRAGLAFLDMTDPLISLAIAKRPPFSFHRFCHVLGSRAEPIRSPATEVGADPVDRHHQKLTRSID